MNNSYVAFILRRAFVRDQFLIQPNFPILLFQRIILSQKSWCFVNANAWRMYLLPIFLLKVILLPVCMGKCGFVSK